MKPETKIKEFSKRVLLWMICMWFICAILGIVVVIWQTVRGDYTNGLSDLLLFVGAPMTGGIVSYMLKSACENKAKINLTKNEIQKNIDEV